LRVIKYMYFDDLSESLSSYDAPFAKLVLSINGLLIVGLFIFPNYLLNQCMKVFGG